MDTLNGKGKTTRSQTKALETKRMTTECPAARVSARSVPSSTPRRVFPIQGIIFASHAHLYIWLLLG